MPKAGTRPEVTDPGMYTIILKIKEGELVALQQSQPASDTRVLLEVLPTPAGPNTEKQLRNTIAAANCPAAIGLDYQAQTTDALDSFEGLMAQIPATDRPKVAPVLHLGSGPRAFSTAAAHADNHSGVLYLRAKVITLCANPAEQALDLIESKRFDPKRVRLVVDFGDIDDPNAYEDWVGDIGIKAAANSPFADVSIAATSYPGSISKLQPGWSKFVRHEMEIWQNRAQGRGIHFADYGCRSTAFPPPPRKFALPVLAQLRYTLRDEYLVYRGETLKSDRQQHYKIGADMVRKIEYFGPEFSWGDLNIESLGRGLGGPRGRSQIISYETAHHLLATEALVSRRSGL